jgi:hypothetical protein
MIGMNLVLNVVEVVIKEVIRVVLALAGEFIEADGDLC